MSKLNAPLPDEPIFHHAEPNFANKLNKLMEAVREIQDHLNSEDKSERKKLEAEQKAAEEEAAKKAAETPSE